MHQLVMQACSSVQQALHFLHGHFLSNQDPLRERFDITRTIATGYVFKEIQQEGYGNIGRMPHNSPRNNDEHPIYIPVSLLSLWGRAVRNPPRLLFHTIILSVEMVKH
jgi:hypothetical protein